MIATGMYDEINDELFNAFEEQINSELKAQAGVLGMSVGYSKADLMSLLDSSFKTGSFSSNIWADKEALVKALESLVTQSILTGEHPVKLAAELKKKMDTTTYNATRIMRTEVSKIQADIQKKEYALYDVDKYEFIAENSSRTCRVCRNLNGRVFKTKDFESGINAQPMHPNCRCTTIPVVEK